jgi:hypothetical protein
MSLLRQSTCTKIATLPENALDDLTLSGTKHGKIRFASCHWFDQMTPS